MISMSNSHKFKIFNDYSSLIVYNVMSKIKTHTLSLIVLNECNLFMRTKKLTKYHNNAFK